MKYKLRCLLLCFLFIFSLQGCQKETKLEKPGNLITTTKNSSKENPNIEDPVETVPITGGTTADINSSTGDESNSEIAEKDGTVDNSNIHIVNSELKKIPESIMEQFQKNGWHIYVTDADINQKFYQGKYSTVLGTTQYADKKIYIANTSQAATESTILSSYPSDSANIYEVLMKGKKTYIAGLHLFFLLILITALFIFTVWLQDTEKKIPVTYSGKLQGKSTFKGVSTNTIPIKLCPGGVVPIIFASSLISFPILIAQIAGAKQNAVLKLLNSGYWFNTSKPWYTFGALIYLVLIFAFSYFYTEITMNPEEIANNIKKSGGNIAGIRAGSSTAEYLRKQMKYLIAIGSFCLCIIAIIPFIVSGLTGLSRLSFFGTSIIITVSVILETKKLILSKTQENYYMNRVKKGGLFRG